MTITDQKYKDEKEIKKDYQVDDLAAENDDDTGFNYQTIEEVEDNCFTINIKSQ